jgi:hypothetical protein
MGCTRSRNANEILRVSGRAVFEQHTLAEGKRELSTRNLCTLICAFSHVLACTARSMTSLDRTCGGGVWVPEHDSYHHLKGIARVISAAYVVSIRLTKHG